MENNRRSNTYRFAKKELRIFNSTTKNSIIQELEDEILELCDKFGNSGQSGGSVHFSASLVCDYLKKLMLQDPISPILCVEEEWVDVYSDVFQNSRCSGLFKNKSDSKIYYIDAIFFKNQDGSVFSSNGIGIEGFLSSQYIKDIPFNPKSFYIDVITDENGESKLKDPSQLEKVWKVYIKP